MEKEHKPTKIEIRTPHTGVYHIPVEDDINDVDIEGLNDFIKEAVTGKLKYINFSQDGTDTVYIPNEVLINSVITLV